MRRVRPRRPERGRLVPGEGLARSLSTGARTTGPFDYLTNAMVIGSKAVIPAFGGMVAPRTLLLAARTATSEKRKIAGDRKSTRLNSSHQIISYAVFCLKKKNQINGTA